MAYGKILARFSTFLVVVICQTSALAQISPGTDSAFAFYPLNTGDVHEFYFEHLLCRSFIADSSYCSERVTGDTLMSNGKIYKVIQSNVPAFFGSPAHYLRIDSATANVYEYEMDYDPPRELLLDSLRAMVNSSFVTFRGLARCYQLDTLDLLGVHTFSKDISIDGPMGGAYRLAYGLGRIEDIAFDPFGCNEFGDNYAIQLVYAKIDGKEYGTLVSVHEEPAYRPLSFELLQSYPNPFNPSTSISYSLPKQTRVRLQVFNPLGQIVTTLVDQEKSPGTYTVKWDASTRPSGLYFYRMTAGEFVQTKKAVHLK